MAWNEPGNNNGNNGRDNDPWGNNNRGNKGGRDQGPPDLDEVFNKLSQKLGASLVAKVVKALRFPVAVRLASVSLQLSLLRFGSLLVFIPSVKLNAALCYALANTTALLIRV